MLKVISTSVLFGLLGTTLPTFAEESRHMSNRTMADDRKGYVKQHTSSHANKYDRHHIIKHTNKHSNTPEYVAFKEHYSYQPAYSQNSYHHHDNHYPMAAYHHQNQYVQYAHPRDRGHYQTSHKGLPHFKRHHVLPKYMTYSRLPRQVENRLGHLPGHLMRVRVGDDIAVIHIKNRIVHEIIRGLL